MLSKLVHEVTHFPGHRVALFLRFQGCAVLQAEEHLPNFFFVCILEHNDIERIRVQQNPEFIREILVFHASNIYPVDLVGIFRQAVLIFVEFSQRTESLLSVNNLVFVRALAYLPPVKLGDVIAAENTIEQQLFLCSRPNGRSLEIGVGVDSVANGERSCDRPRLLACIHVTSFRLALQRLTQTGPARPVSLPRSRRR